MKKTEIELKGVYEGSRGSKRPPEQRKVIQIIGNEVKFEVVANPNPCWGFGWKIGSTHQIFLQNFARWAARRIQ